MKKFIILLIIAAVGYVFYPSLGPALMDMAGLKPHQKQAKPTLAKNTPTPPKNQAPKKAQPESPIVKIPYQNFPKDQPKLDLPDTPDSTGGIDSEDPEMPDEPEVVLGEADFKRMIIKAVEEEGKYIPFKQDNIIEWALKEIQIERVNDHYEGEITVEVGDLFGKHLRRAQLYIEDESIIKWEWLKSEEK